MMAVMMAPQNRRKLNPIMTYPQTPMFPSQYIIAVSFLDAAGTSAL
jgi:hypothetical protein